MQVEQMSDNQVLLAMLIMTAVTFSLRAMPFFFRGLIEKNTFFSFIKFKLPAMMLFVLVFYAIGAHQLNPIGEYAQQTLALVVTAAVHLMRGNFLLSIFAGTGCYIFLLNT